MINIEKLTRTNDQLFIKNLMLTTEFNKYIIEHPDILEKIPDNASVILLPADDIEFCNQMISLVKKFQRTDDLENRPLVFIKIQKIAPPPPSRIIDIKFEPATICK